MSWSFYVRQPLHTQAATDHLYFLPNIPVEREIFIPQIKAKQLESIWFTAISTKHYLVCSSLCSDDRPVDSWMHYLINNKKIATMKFTEHLL